VFRNSITSYLKQIEMTEQTWNKEQVEAIKQAFFYDPETGIITWRQARSGIRVGQQAGSLSRADGYIAIMLNRLTYSASTIAWVFITGDFPAGQLDHIDHIRSNDKAINLRLASQHENLKNRTRQSNNVTGITGVHLDRSKGKYRAQIGVDGKHVYLGTFADIEDAIAARKAAESKYGFHPNHGTSPAPKHMCPALALAIERLEKMKDENISPLVNTVVDCTLADIKELL